jgi:hypothetical protein
MRKLLVAPASLRSSLWRRSYRARGRRKANRLDRYRSFNVLTTTRGPRNKSASLVRTIAVKEDALCLWVTVARSRPRRRIGRTSPESTEARFLSTGGRIRILTAG